MDQSALQDVDLSSLPEPLRQAIQARMEMERQERLREQAEREKAQAVADRLEAEKNAQQTRAVAGGALKLAVGVAAVEALAHAQILGVAVDFVEHLPERIHARRTESSPANASLSSPQAKS